jgi:hypothetical protein
LGAPPPARRADESDCEAVPISSGPLDVGALRFEGGFELIGRSSLFGGLSGLAALDERRLLALTDTGMLATIALSTDASGAPTARCELFDLLDTDGSALWGKDRGDAEDLAFLAPDRIAVSFEREHRVAVFTLDGRQVGEAIDFSRGARLEPNRGLEALAALPSGDLLVGTETPTLFGATQGVWRLPVETPSAPREPTFSIAAAGAGFALVGLDATPGGGVVVLQRFFESTFGYRARIGWLAPGVAETATGTVRMRELARLPYGSGLPTDNFEDVAAVAGADGRTTLWIVSDDNFNDDQKTLLYRFSFDERAEMSGS